MYPVLFQVGKFPVHAWGVLLMAGFLLAAWRAAKNAHRYAIAPEDVWDISLLGLLGGVIGARLAYVGLNLTTMQEGGGPGFLHQPGAIFAVWQGGMTFYGGLFGGILAGILACRLKKVNVGDMADLAAMSFPLGYALGRIGCLLNGCCYGGVCELPWAVRFHRGDGTLTVPSHPAQLYSALIAVAMYALLLPIERGRKFRGQVMLAYIVLYGIYRFIIEFVREGVTAQTTSILHLTQGQVFSLLMSLVAAIAYLVLLGRPQQVKPVPAA
jgi:phosphatidylglycerol:prolipoprotein diacylglycerol transferase